MKVLNLIRDFELQKMKEFKSVKEYSDRLLSIANKVRLLGFVLKEMTSRFSTILESFNTEPNNLTLLAMLRSLSEYSFTDSDSFIFCNSKR